jgi:hypothetical protein
MRKKKKKSYIIVKKIEKLQTKQFDLSGSVYIFLNNKLFIYICANFNIILVYKVNF